MGTASLGDRLTEGRGVKYLAGLGWEVGAGIPFSKMSAALNVPTGIRVGPPLYVTSIDT